MEITDSSTPPFEADITRTTTQTVTNFMSFRLLAALRGVVGSRDQRAEGPQNGDGYFPRGLWPLDGIPNCGVLFALDAPFVHGF